MKTNKSIPAIFTIAIAFVLILTQSAFRPNLTPNYGKDLSDDWHLIGSRTMVSPNTVPNSTQYRCLESEEEVCTAEFDYTSPSNDANDYISGSESLGIYDFGN